ncbi:MAG: PhpK family radical SAM P-methyltransferase [Blastocatellia bacterium]|nr:PhpK family radical SAM P-methyltransferase [Blastocatellia bacterium]
MTVQSDKLDCIIIGHNDLDFRLVEDDLKKTDNYCGAYKDLKANSVNLRGERMTYMNLLNRTLKTATGKEPNLHMGTLPHLGAIVLKNFLDKRRFATEIINSFNFDRDRLADLLASSPRAVAITTTLYVENTPIIEIVDFIRRHNPETKIIVGGPHIFNLCSTQEQRSLEFICQMIGADIYIFDSQGELTLSLVLEELRRGNSEDLSHVPNLIYTSDNKTFHTTKQVIEDNPIDESSIDWKLFDVEFYTPTVQIRTARSCAFSCSFCKYPAMAGPLNLISLDVIERELRHLDSSGVKNLVFIDDTFNVPFPRFKDICRMMIRNEFSFDWYSFFRCSNADDEAFDLMEKSRCKGVFLGIESGDQTILKDMNKFSSVDRYKYGIGRLKERGITTFASIIVGFPGETEASVRNTMDFLEETSPDFYRAELYYHYVNVPIHQQAEKFGIRGAGYSWKHNTMDWKQAVGLAHTMYKTIKGPSVLPGYMFDFWAIPYLTGKGFTVGQIKDFTRIAQEIMVEGLDDTVPDTQDQERRLVALFQRATASA